jgi:uncharacterized protein YegJ (DUF2314 family)
MEVDRVAGGKIEGRLINEPVDLGDLKKNAKVEVELGRVEDWVIFRGDKMDGNFTTPVVQKIQEERLQKR